MHPGFKFLNGVIDIACSIALSSTNFDFVKTRSEKRPFLIILIFLLLQIYKYFDVVRTLFSLCRVYTCRFDNQIPNEKLVKKYFLVAIAKLAQYFVCEEDRKLSSYCKQEI